MTNDTKRNILLALGILVVVGVLDQRDLWVRGNIRYGVSFTPPPETEQAYHDLAVCLRREITIPFSALQWEIGEGPVPNIFAHDNSQDELVGAFDYRTNTIYVREGTPNMTGLILHELTHAIAHPEGGHPAWAFTERCGNAMDEG